MILALLLIPVGRRRLAPSGCAPTRLRRALLVLTAAGARRPDRGRAGRVRPGAARWAAGCALDAPGCCS